VFLIPQGRWQGSIKRWGRKAIECIPERKNSAKKLNFSAVCLIKWNESNVIPCWVTTHSAESIFLFIPGYFTALATYLITCC
jgi:hypothetical protein